MLPPKQAEEAAIPATDIATFSNETAQGGDKERGGETASVFSMKSLLWHGGSAWDAWFSCASNQVLHTHTDHKLTKIPFVSSVLSLLTSGAGVNCRWRRCC